MMKKAYYKYISSLFLFGMNGIVASYIALSSYQIVFTRTFIASLMLVLLFIATKQKMHLLKDKRQACYMLVSGIAMGTSWMFLYEAYQEIGVSIATLAYYCGPVIVLILSPVFFKEKISWSKAMGFVIVLVGLLCVNEQALSEGKTAFGLFCGIASAVLYAVMVIGNKKAESITGMENAMWQMIVSCVTVMVFLLLKQGFSLNIGLDSIFPILILGLVNTGLGCYLYFSAIGHLPVQTVAICGYLEPLSAIFFSSLFLHESMNILQLIGTMLIFGGALFGELKKSKM